MMALPSVTSTFLGILVGTNVVKIMCMGMMKLPANCLMTIFLNEINKRLPRINAFLE